MGATISKQAPAPTRTETKNPGCCATRTAFAGRPQIKSSITSIRARAFARSQLALAETRLWRPCFPNTMHAPKPNRCCKYTIRQRMACRTCLSSHVKVGEHSVSPLTRAIDRPLDNANSQTTRKNVMDVITPNGETRNRYVCTVASTRKTNARPSVTSSQLLFVVPSTRPRH